MAYGFKGYRPGTSLRVCTMPCPYVVSNVFSVQVNGDQDSDLKKYVDWKVLQTAPIGVHVVMKEKGNFTLSFTTNP